MSDFEQLREGLVRLLRRFPSTDRRGRDGLVEDRRPDRDWGREVDEEIPPHEPGEPPFDFLDRIANNSEIVASFGRPFEGVENITNDENLSDLMRDGSAEDLQEQRRQERARRARERERRDQLERQRRLQRERDQRMAALQGDIAAIRSQLGDEEFVELVKTCAEQAGATSAVVGMREGGHAAVTAGLTVLATNSSCRRAFIAGYRAIVETIRRVHSRAVERQRVAREAARFDRMDENQYEIERIDLLMRTA